MLFQQIVYRPGFGELSRIPENDAMIGYFDLNGVAAIIVLMGNGIQLAEGAGSLDVSLAEFFSEG